jgi:polysaccharide pyruvyl transferase WcaK-like protein
MKILHVATFIGNIGDNASHLGFDQILEENLGSGHQIDRLEIRKTYSVYTLPDKWSFDDDFAKKANDYDLLLIGGGHFLDFWVKNSHTGTTLDISDEVLEALNVPMFIVSMGSMHRTDVPPENILKYRAFLDKLMKRPQTEIAIRNDGSHRVLRQDIGDKYADRYPEVLDSGYFYRNDGSMYKPLPGEYVVMNSTVDQLTMKSHEVGQINADTYIDEMVKVMNYIINETELNIVLAPHIYKDFEAFDYLLKKMNTFHIRTRIAVAPYVQDDWGCDQIFSAYANASLVVGMRFHSNVCSMALNKLSYGIAATDRIVNAYNSVGLQDRYVTVDKPFSSELIEKINYGLTNREEVLAKSKSNINLKCKETLKTYNKLFANLNLK